MAHTISVLGVGPGSPDYLVPIAASKLAEAEVVVGSARLLKTFARSDQKVYQISGDLLAAMLYIIEQSATNRVAVLVSGDSGLYSFANYLTTHIGDGNLEIIPGISSVQLLFARIKRNWENIAIISAHGRNDVKDRLVLMVQQQIPVAVLTGGENTPQKIAGWLVAAGCFDVKVVVGSNLSYPNEKIYHSHARALYYCQEQLDNSVMVIGSV